MGRSGTTHAGGGLTDRQDRFVALIGQGVSYFEACRVVGINRRTGTRWRLGRTIRNTAGEAVHYPPVRILTPQERHPRYLSLEERTVIADLRREKRTLREIAAELGRSAGTISRELRRNVEDDGRYLPRRADQAATARMARLRARRVMVDGELRAVVWTCWVSGGARSRSRTSCATGSTTLPAGCAQSRSTRRSTTPACRLAAQPSGAADAGAAGCRGWSGEAGCPR